MVSREGSLAIHSRLSSPTCQDLGIPHDAADLFPTTPLYVKADCDDDAQQQQENDFKLHDLVYDPRNPNNPFSPYSRIPLPSPYGNFEYGLEPAFIRKRNERERERVRCVNEGYARLRQHLPLERKDKRISKVETLRSAIRYIEYLQGLLDKCASEGRKVGENSVKAKHNTRK